MSAPSVLSPWYVVQRFYEWHNPTKGEPGNDYTGSGGFMTYYTSMEVDTTEFTEEKRHALLFMSLASAARVAEDCVAEVRVLYTEDHAKEFDRG